MSHNKEQPVVFDCVVMLTASNWFKELRSNRYHYATRFAAHYPVLFIQPDKALKGYIEEPTEVENLSVVHVSSKFDIEQSQSIECMLREKGFRRPLYWVYNVNFAGFLYRQAEQFIVFHATEDYLSKDSPICFKKGMGLRSRLLACLKLTNLLIAVSNGVHESYINIGQYQGQSIVIGNGCDYAFYAKGTPLAKTQKVAFYQGNIFGKLDYALLAHLIKTLSDWTFVFCGPVLFNEPEWQVLLAYRNVKYLGVLTPEAVREQAYQSTVGLIPFKQEAWLTKKSLPLKAFEYLACGLPVVSISIDALKPFQKAFYFADTKAEFKEAMLEAEASRWQQDHIDMRQTIARQHSYDAKFEVVFDLIQASHVKQGQNKALSTRWGIFLKWILHTARLRHVLKQCYKHVLQR